MKADDLEKAALSLNPPKRAELAAKLLRSFEALSDVENSELWVEEARRRDSELYQDSSQARAAEDVLRDARSRLV